ncbi:hypothetical protein TNCT_433841 [Trichonephila clavata]|uniref:Uncharacterized protein n=1 Tax=Trichonephila clavata TaxID=2740835 RepID=A0A8X6FCT2_TRICU|nr:hypothetical protein TNCT_433841 [Trichonephila clavata]
MLAHKAKHSESCPDLSFEIKGTQRPKNTLSHIEISAIKNKQELKGENSMHQSKNLEFKTRSGAVGFKGETADRLPRPKGSVSSNTGYELVNPFLEKHTIVPRQKPKAHRHAGQHSLELSESSTRRLNLHYSDQDSPISAGAEFGASCANIMNNKTLHPRSKYPYLSQRNRWENQSCSEIYCGDRCKKSNLDIRNTPERWMYKNQSDSDIRKQDWIGDSSFSRPERLNQYKEQLQYRLIHRVQYTTFQPRYPGENSRHKCSNRHIVFKKLSSKPLASTSYASNQRQPSLADIEADYELINERYITRSNSEQQMTERRNRRSRMGRLIHAIRERLRKAFSRQDRF